MSTTRLAKRELRKHLKKILASIPNESVTHQTNKILTALLALPEYTSARNISIYLSMPTAEVQTSLLVGDALKTGKRVFIPYCYKRATPISDQAAKPSQIMDMLELHSLSDYESLQLDSWGIPTPSEDSLKGRKNCFGGFGRSEGLNVGDGSREDELDLIITPGLGFDRNLGRIGRGMGFYDCFFERCKQFSKRERVPMRVGLALNEQILPVGQTVPMDETDQQVDALILGDGSVLRQ